MRGKLVYVVALSALVLGSHSTSALDLVKEGGNFLDSLSGGTASQSLSVGEIAGGLKDALKVGTGNVVRQLGRENGFNNDPLIHIPLPDSLKTVPSALDKIGMSSMLDDLEVKLNRAAEQATPEAKKLFWGAIERNDFGRCTGNLQWTGRRGDALFSEKDVRALGWRDDTNC